MNRSQHDALVAGLPPLSKVIYTWLNEVGLYAEPGFSDVTVSDIAEKLNLNKHAVAGALSHLHELELTNTEEWESNFKKQEFIHTVAHENGWSKE